MPGGPGKLRPEDNPKPFSTHPENINRNGAPISIRKEIKQLLASDGKMRIEWKNVEKIVQDEYIEVIIPKKDMIAMKLFHWAMSKKGNDSTKAIQMIIEHIDGRPHQTTSVDINEPINQINLTDEQFNKIMDELIPKELKEKEK